jgi:outer membrane protein
MKNILLLSFVSFFLAFHTGNAQAADTLQVTDAIVLSLQNNFGITLARNNLRIADVNNTIGAAGMLPRLDLTGSKTRTVNDTKQEYFNGTTKESHNAVNKAFNSGLQLTWTIFDGFNMFIQRNKLNELQNLSDIQLRSVIENTVAQVIQTYYDIVAQEALAKVYREALQISSNRKNFAEARYNLGSGSELAVLQAIVDMNADSANLIRQDALIENIKSDLNLLLCRNITEPFQVMQGIPINTSLKKEELTTRSDKSNPDLMIARNAISLANFAVNELRSTQLPRINLNSSFRFSNTSSDADLFKYSRTYGYTVGLSLSYNIFNGFTNRQKISAARIRSESAETDLKNTRLEVETNLTEVFNDYLTNLKLVSFENRSLEFARHNFEVAQEKYRIGSLNDVEFRETQAKMMEAENRLLSAQYRCKLAETELLRLSGQLSAETE